MVFPKVFRRPKEPSGKPKNTKENQRKPSGKQKNTVFKGFRPTLGYVFCFFVWFSRRFLENKKHFRENQTYQRTPKKTKHFLGKTKHTKVFKGFRPTLGYVLFFLFFFVFLVFPKVFRKNTFGKTKHTKENQRTPNKTFGKTKQTKFLKVSDPPLDMFFLLFFWFSQRFLENKKHFRENQTYQRKQKKTQTFFRDNQTYQSF